MFTPATIMHQTQIFGVTVVAYLAKESGEGVEEHEHDFDHTVCCVAGSVAIRTPEKERVLTPEDPPVVVRKGVKHSIIGLAPKSVFHNIMPY